MAALYLVAACAPAAPTTTRTPEPAATPAEVLATKVEHLGGLWWCRADVGDYQTWGGPYYRWDDDGTVWWAEDAGFTTRPFSGTFWFDDGLYHEESHLSIGIGVYEIYLEIEGGQAVGLRLVCIEEGAPPHPQLFLHPRKSRYRLGFDKVD
jgi:hypothetical protein